MNPYISAQITNMKASVNNCCEACHWAAREDDSMADPKEHATLKKIDKAVERFLRELDKIK